MNSRKTMFVTGVVVCFWYQLLNARISGVTLSPCGDASDKTAEVEQGRTDNTFTCSGLGDGLRVDWTVVHDSNELTAGYCPAGSGDCQQGNVAYTTTRVSGTESKVVIDPTAVSKKDQFERGTLKCQDSSDAGDSCQMDYIVPATGNCSIQTGIQSSRFQLNGSCSLQPGAKSSRNRFRCVWDRQGGAAWQFTVPLTENTYQTRCTLTGQHLPTVSGQYTYTVTLFPGRQAVDAAGTIDITRPSAPTVTGCGGDDYIPVNTTVRCTCTTDTIGQPAGRLRWIKVGDSSVNKVGNYGDKAFTVSKTLLRSDAWPEFRCSVEWTEDIPGTSFKFNVGFPPTQAVIKLNGLAKGDLIVKEHQSVDFRCQRGIGLPEPTMNLMRVDNSSVLLSKKYFLSHVVVGRCEDGGQYVCTAENGMGPKFTGTPKFLLITCSPRGPGDVGEVTFINDPVSLVFDVTAYPIPHQLTFRYLGPSEADTGTFEVSDAQIQLTGVCQPKAGVVYQSTCTVTVTSVTMETAAGFYYVIVTNAPGSGHFRFRVLYKEKEPEPKEPEPKEPEPKEPEPKEPEPKEPKPSDAEDEVFSHLVLAIGLAVGLAVVVVVNIIIVIWLWRRQWTLPCADTPKSNDPINPISSGNLGSSVRSETSSHYYLTPISGPAEETGSYDSLPLDDVVLRSEYTGITSPGNPAVLRATTSSETFCEPYDTIDDVGLRSEYPQITSPDNHAPQRAATSSETFRKLYESTESESMND